MAIAPDSDDTQSRAASDEVDTHDAEPPDAASHASDSPVQAHEDPDPAQFASAPEVDERALLLAQIDRHARWLLWIAGLSLVNVAMTVGDSDRTFAVGLFGAQVIAVIAKGIAGEGGNDAILWAGAALAALPALVVGLLYFPSRHGERWALALGIAAYSLDFILLLGLGLFAGETDILGLGIHVWALVSLATAWRLSSRLADAR